MQSSRPRIWTVVKFAHDGRPPVRYQAEEFHSSAHWIAVSATWTHGLVDTGHMYFENGDDLYEYFALDAPFNAFAVYRASGEFGGWYCNVTYPTEIVDGEIHWHDLYIDVIVRPEDGEIVILDEDELEASDLARSDPDLHKMIHEARDEIVRRIRAREYPFSEAPSDSL
ncbi:MAG: DUF402 domain-containing protein [Chloroflexota bacterium]